MHSRHLSVRFKGEGRTTLAGEFERLKQCEGLVPGPVDKQSNQFHYIECLKESFRRSAKDVRCMASDTAYMQVRWLYSVAYSYDE